MLWQIVSLACVRSLGEIRRNEKSVFTSWRRQHHHECWSLRSPLLWGGQDTSVSKSHRFGLSRIAKTLLLNDIIFM